MGFPEKYLVKKAKSGNKYAFGKLVEKYQEKILHLAFDLVKDYDEAKDIAQEAFIRAYEKLDQFREQSQFSTWLYRIAVNLANDHQRRQKRNFQQQIDIYAKQPDLKSDWDDAVLPEKIVENKELRGEIESALEKLSPNQRTAVVLRYFHQKTSTEIASIMECTENTVRIHIFRALKNLRKCKLGVR